MPLRIPAEKRVEFENQFFYFRLQNNVNTKTYYYYFFLGAISLMKGGGTLPIYLVINHYRTYEKLPYKGEQYQFSG